MEVRLSRGDWSRLELWRAKGLFLRAFPAEERPPFRVMLRQARCGVDWWKVLADGRFAGFLYVLRDAELAYVFHFAILREFRGLGVGTEAIKRLICEYHGRRLFLAIERMEPRAANLEEREKRKRFYLRCGLEELRQHVREGDVVYELLGVGGRVSDGEYQALVRGWLAPGYADWVRMEVLD